MKKCKVCGESIPQGRLNILPFTQTCVLHSTSSPYKGIVTLEGEGDHTWNDIKLVDDSTFEKYANERSK